jgi:hypothetical protein
VNKKLTTPIFPPLNQGVSFSYFGAFCAVKAVFRYRMIKNIRAKDSGFESLTTLCSCSASGDVCLPAHRQNRQVPFSKNIF